MILKDAREVSFIAVRDALTHELREDGPNIDYRAHELLSIAVHNRVLVEDLLVWIHVRHPHKEWSREEFLLWCAKLKAFQEEFLARLRQERDWQQCASCAVHMAQRIGNCWYCPECGLIEPVEPLAAEPEPEPASTTSVH